jgi:iron complex transport system permease protein
MTAPTLHASPVASSGAPTVTSHRAVRHRLALLALAATALVVLYQFSFVGDADASYVMGLRFRQLGALVVVGVGTGFATVLFQTIANSRILTPGVMGFDALFVLVQTIFVAVFGSAIVVDVDVSARFLVDLVVMSAFGTALFRWIFRRSSRDLFVLVLIGIVLGALFTSLSLFASRLLSPDDFLTLQDLTFASFNTVDSGLLAITAVITLAAIAAGIPLLRLLDVVALGRDSAVTLGVNYHRVVTATLLVVTVLVAAATALVGPLTFVGLIVANLARRVLPTYRHAVLVTGAALWGIAFVVGGQFLVSRVLGFSTTLTVCVNLVGGVYYVWLLLREATS